MTWWQRNKGQVAQRQDQADRALEISKAKLERVESMESVVAQKVGVLNRLNSANNFGRRVELAYMGRE